MSKQKMRERYSALKKTGQLAGTIKDATAKREKRDAIEGPGLRFPHPLPTLARTRHNGQLHVIPLGLDDSARVGTWARRKRPRLTNWDGATASSTWSMTEQFQGAMWIDEVDNGQYSGRCKYTHWTYEPRMISGGMVTARRLVAKIGVTMCEMDAPRGWRFGTDHLGLYIVRLRETRAIFRYHFDSDDVRAGKAAIRAAAMAHERGRRNAGEDNRAASVCETGRFAWGRKKTEVKVIVTRDDSISAGNCRAGTIAFARQHGLNRAAYPAETILEKTSRNGGRDGRLVRQAIRIAYDRTIRDLRKGWDGTESAKIAEMA
jgi:hypothetical protein